MQEIPRVVAVTGAAGYIGRRLVERLLSEAAVERVVGVDIQPAPLAHAKLTYLRQDINAPLDAAFHDMGVTAVVHLAFAMRQTRRRSAGRRVNVEGTRNILRACDAAGVKHLVLMSSSTVYGPRPDNQPFLLESAPLRPPRGFAYAVDKAACEALCQEYGAAHPETTLTVLRGCVVMGPHAKNFITDALDKPVLIGVRGADPPMQFIHEEDLLAVLWECLRVPRGGTYNVAGPGTVRWSEMVAMAGKRLVPLPAAVAYGLTAAAWRLRLQNDAPSVGLDFIRWPWTVSTAKLETELGYVFKHTSRGALLDYLSGRVEHGHAVPR